MATQLTSSEFDGFALQAVLESAERSSSAAHPILCGALDGQNGGARVNWPSTLTAARRLAEAEGDAALLEDLDIALRAYAPAPRE